LPFSTPATARRRAPPGNPRTSRRWPSIATATATPTPTPTSTPTGRAWPAGTSHRAEPARGLLPFPRALTIMAATDSTETDHARLDDQKPPAQPRRSPSRPRRGDARYRAPLGQRPEHEATLPARHRQPPAGSRDR